MAPSTRLTTAIAVGASTLLLAGTASAAHIQTLRDVSARDGRALPAKSIQVVRDIGARPAVPHRHPAAIRVVRDTAARDTQRTSRSGNAAIAYFWATEHSRT